MVAASKHKKNPNTKKKEEKEHRLAEQRTAKIQRLQAVSKPEH